MSETLKDNELKKVNGGDGNGTFKYVFTDIDWVYDNEEKTITITIEENISTNDDGAMILARKNTAGSIEEDDGSGYYRLSASRIIYHYRNYGGKLHAM